MNIGEKIRRLRIENELTQEDLASRCELSKGFISQVERDLTSPSIATLMDILECLGTDIQEFFNEKVQQKIVITKDDMFVKEDELGHSIEWLVPHSQKLEMEPIRVVLDPHGCTHLYQPFEGEEFGYVLSGTITLQIGNKKYKAKKGESFYFIANEQHQIFNEKNTKAEFIWVMTPPNF